MHQHYSRLTLCFGGWVCAVVVGSCTHASAFWPEFWLDRCSVSALIHNVCHFNSPLSQCVMTATCQKCLLGGRKNVLKRPKSIVSSSGLNSSASHVFIHQILTVCICIYFHDTGGIIPLHPDPVFARKLHSASFLGAHFCYIATRAVSGAKAQYTLPAICLPLLSNFQVRG